MPTNTYEAQRHVEWDIVLLKAHATFNNVCDILVCWFCREAFVKPSRAQDFICPCGCLNYMDE